MHFHNFYISYNFLPLATHCAGHTPNPELHASCQRILQFDSQIIFQLSLPVSVRIGFQYSISSFQLAAYSSHTLSLNQIFQRIQQIGLH